MRIHNPNNIQQNPDGSITDKYGAQYEVDTPYFDRIMAKETRPASPFLESLKIKGAPDRTPPQPKKRGRKPGTGKTSNKTFGIDELNKYVCDMIHPPFYYCIDQGPKPGAGFVISTDPPYHVGRVIIGKTNDRLHEFLEQRNIQLFYKCSDYPVAIVPMSPLAAAMEETNPEPVFKDFIFRSMAEFFTETKILPNERNYTRHERKN